MKSTERKHDNGYIEELYPILNFTLLSIKHSNIF